MNVLVACEYSGVVRDAFIREGRSQNKNIYAVSCDILPSESSYGEHIQGDILQPELIDFDMFDLIIAHPPCTYLCNSGVRWLYEGGKSNIVKTNIDRQRWDDMEKGCKFFNFFLNNFKHKKICIENPVQHKYAKERIKIEPTQYIQPWMFGHGETKKTGLWLNNLPKLQPTNIVDGRDNRIHKISGKNRGKERSRFFTGIAEAMAKQRLL